MDLETLALATTGLGVIAGGVWNGIQSVKTRKAANQAAKNAQPVSNGFAAHVKDQLAEVLRVSTEARDEAKEANAKIDRHIEAHADAHLASPVVRLVRDQK